MDSGSEGDVAIAGPIDDELVGVLEVLRVVARGGEVHENLVAGLDAGVVVVDVDLGHAGHRDRCVEAKALLHR